MFHFIHGGQALRTRSLWILFTWLVSLPRGALEFTSECWSYRWLSGTLGFYEGPGDPNPGLLTCAASALCTEQSLRPSVQLLSKIQMRIRKVKVEVLGPCHQDPVMRLAFLGPERGKLLLPLWTATCWCPLRTKLLRC